MGSESATLRFPVSLMEINQPLDLRSNAYHHRDTCPHLALAVLNLRRALKQQEIDGGELEWAGAIRELLEQAEHVHSRVSFYAKG
jgi:hypothetical protein